MIPHSVTPSLPHALSVCHTGLILDNLPVAVLRQRRDGSPSKIYEHGFRVGFKGKYAGSKDEKYFINNHLSFKVMYHNNSETDSARIVGFEVTPYSVEYTMSYVYHAMYAYFDRDNIALPGLAKFYKESSEEEREHAEKLMEYQNKRGGRVKLHTIGMPCSEFEHAEKGDALYSMELALSLEKLTNEKLLGLHHVADRNNDPQLTEFIESEYLTEQVEAIKKIADYVTQLRMVGKGHGVWHFDQMLLHEGDAA